MARDLESMLDAVLDGVVLLNARGEVESLNSEACRILETSTEAAVGLPIEDLLGQDQSIAKLSRGVLADGRAVIDREYSMQERQGDALVVDASASPLFCGDDLDGVALMLRDRTIQKSLRDVVSQREALASFGRIAAGIAHEIKNPLGGIRGAAEILGARAGDDKSRSAAELIVREVDRIALLVDDFMVFTPGEDLRVAPVNIHQVLDGVLALTAHEKIAANIEVERVFDPSIPDLTADADRLSQVFLNLIRNAFQAMEDEGGKIVITTRMAFDHHLSPPNGDLGPSLIVELADTGRGIEAAILDEVATPFFTTRSEGTGLGLSVARHWIARHDGTLHLESTLGVGTTVRIVLPVSRPK
ncbi:MAG: PAS domain-containing protein [Myxococcales bacterium]|nr:PAS domain-containing protein [Myxococcales bacterium]